MTIKFNKLTRANLRKLVPKQSLNEHGIFFERLASGDGRYTINIMVDGKRVHRVIGKESEGVTRKHAEELIETLRTDARHGRLNLPKGRKVALGFSSAADNYISKLEKEGGNDLKMKKSRLTHHLKPFFKDIPLSQISTSEIERYKKFRRDEEKAKVGTINRELAALSHLITQALEWKWISYKPCKIKRYKEDQGRIVYLTTEQVKHLLNIAQKDDCNQVYPFIAIGVETSLRRMDILSIELKHIDLAKLVIFIPKSKTGAREQPITQNLANILKAYIKNAESEQVWLFPSKRSKTGHTVAIEKAYRRVVKVAGFNPAEVLRHTLRHTAITHLVQAGVDLPTVQRISGHKTLQMVVRYSHQNGEHIRAAMNTLEKRYKSVSTLQNQVAEKQAA